MKYFELVQSLKNLAYTVENAVKCSQTITPDMTVGYDDTLVLLAIDFVNNLADDANEVALRECGGPDDIDESMDGDHASALASAGFGTDEDYGYYGPEE